MEQEKNGYQDSSEEILSFVDVLKASDIQYFSCGIIKKQNIMLFLEVIH